MAIEKKATVHWEGRGKQGKGQISTETGALSSYPYGFASRFEGDKRGTNPEELLGAAHAACFAMAFSFTCDKAGLETKVVDAKALNGFSDFSPFEGKKLRGWPVATIKAGTIIAKDGKIVGKRNGHYLPREARKTAADLEWLRRAV